MTSGRCPSTDQLVGGGSSRLPWRVLPHELLSPLENTMLASLPSLPSTVHRVQLANSPVTIPARVIRQLVIDAITVGLRAVVIDGPEAHDVPVRRINPICVVDADHGRSSSTSRLADVVKPC
jgi:hypothetical protein